jgi:hypothetical protein
MTDLEMTKLCAEAMGTPPWVVGDQYPDSEWFWPLRHDAQAMALVKRFRLDIWWPFNAEGGWRCAVGGKRPAENADLNRAIVECVASMSKTPSS